MTDESDDDEIGEIEVEPETPELWIDAECGYVADVPALCAEFGIVALTMCEGGLTAYVRGKGAVALGELLKSAKAKRPTELRVIRGEK